MMKTRHRAYAYVTHESRLLVFTHPLSPEAGIQVPAGTIREREDPASAALREAREKTGLSALRVLRFLAQDTRDMRDCGTDELQYRWFYHVACDDVPPERWSHGEFDAAGRLLIPFDFFWVQLPNGVPKLVANYDDMLPQLMASLGKEPNQAGERTPAGDDRGQCRRTGPLTSLPSGVGRKTHVTIRTATEADAARLAELISRSFADVAVRFALTRENCPQHPSNCTVEWVEQDQNRGVQYFIAEQAGEPVGCVALETKDAGTCELRRLAVLPHCRQRGVGRLLVQHVVDSARASGAVRLCLSIIAKHSELRAWYRRLGFRDGETKTFPHLPFEVLFMDADIPKIANR